jgi:hypothetical protein
MGAGHASLSLVLLLRQCGGLLLHGGGLRVQNVPHGLKPSVKVPRNATMSSTS